MTAIAAPPIDITRALAIEGWMSEAELTWLATRAHDAARIIEIGCWQGRSTRALADHCPGRVYAVDAWEDYRLLDPKGAKALAARKAWPLVRTRFAEHLAEHLLSGRVVPWPVPAHAAAALFGHLGQHWVDLIFIDGDHREPAVSQDIADYRPFVRPGGILAGHDYDDPYWPDVRRAVEAAFPRGVQRCESIWWVTL